jgi:predicted neutral ceramidase superfamily lipid hydrolase
VEPGTSREEIESIDIFLAYAHFHAYAFRLVTLLSIPGIFLLIRRREPAAIYILAVLFVYPLMYYVVFADMRYRLPVLWLSLLAAGYFLHACLEEGWFRRRAV